MLLETTGASEEAPQGALTPEDLAEAQRLVRRIPVGETVLEAILDLVRAARPGEGDEAITKWISWGPGPRASQALMLGVRARAPMDGRYAPSADDVAALAEPVLQHRMAVTFAARAEGRTVQGLIGQLVQRLG
jgi:MoxR-like ATPase